MAFKYQKAVPWGRSFDEYQRMFHLTERDLGRSTLGCADGPAGFNARMAKNGHRVVSCDPLYQLSSGQIKQRIDETYAEVMGQTYKNKDRFIWERIASPEELGQVRLQAMNEFLADYEQGCDEGRYVPAELPYLPFASSSFGLALCSHFLFFYHDSLSLEFHQQSLDELCRVANEIRIFPILTYNAEPSDLVKPAVDYLERTGRIVSLERVPYEFQIGGHTMMKIISRPDSYIDGC